MKKLLVALFVSAYGSDIINGVKVSRGGVGTIVRGKISGQDVAFKLFNNGACKWGELKDELKNAEILQTVDSPYVLKFLGSYFSQCALAYEYVDGTNLAEFMVKTPDLNIMEITAKIIQGLVAI